MGSENRKGMMKASLCESLRELMLKRVFEKITIKQICDETGVIRATFYNYFDDKYDCLNAIVYHDLVEEMMSDLSSEKARDVIIHALNAVDVNREFYRIAYNVTGQNSFEEMIRGCLRQLFEEYFKVYRRPGCLEQYPDTLLAGYYAESMAFVIKVFVYQKDGPLTARQAAQMSMDLMNHGFTYFMNYDYKD
jgi:AcrR family transcriptional regulator